jgi:signal transduction histidine kinase
MRRLRYALWPAGLAYGLAAEWAGRPQLIAFDAAAGFALMFLGLMTWARRPGSRAGTIMSAAGFAWFLGTLWPPAVVWHRAPLAQLLISYPSGRLSSRLQQVGAAAAYGYAAVAVVAGSPYATVIFAVGVVALSAYRYVAVTGPERRARRAPLTAAVACGLVLVADAIARLVGVGADRVVLLAYDLTVCLIAIGLAADLLWRRWAQGAVTGLVVDLGEPAAGGVLRDRLAGALGDPTLVVGYWLPGQRSYVDEAGRPVLLPAASRRRIVEASSEQRSRLERELREGAERRLGRVEELLRGGGDQLADVRAGLDAARAELREFARGIHPVTLTVRGLQGAVGELAGRSPITVAVAVPATRFPPAVEAAAYFVCAESLTNVAKHAEASQVHISITQEYGQLRVVIADDGIGGADPSRSSGLRGLADRVEALGGSLAVDSPPGGGTQVMAELPCG